MTEWIKNLSPEHNSFLSEKFREKSEDEIRNILYSLGYSDFYKNRLEFLNRNLRKTSIDLLTRQIERYFGKNQELILFVNIVPKTFFKPTYYYVYDIQLPSYMDVPNNWTEIYNSLVTNWKALTTVHGKNKQIYVFTNEVANALEFLEKHKDAFGFIPNAPPAPIITDYWDLIDKYLQE